MHRTDNFLFRIVLGAHHTTHDRLRRAIVALVFILGASIVVPASATLHSGQASLFPGDGYDFSDSLITGAELDFIFIVTSVKEATSTEKDTNAGSDLFVALSSASILYVGNADTTYDSLLTAPTDTSLYGDDEIVILHDVFVVHTREGHYAKMRITTSGARIGIEYVYQDDGTPSFSDTTPVHMVTWGRLKSLYR